MTTSTIDIPTMDNTVAIRSMASTSFTVPSPGDPLTVGEHWSAVGEHLGQAGAVTTIHLDRWMLHVGRAVMDAIRPHLGRLHLSVTTLWEVVPSPIRRLAGDLYPHVQAVVMALTMAVTITVMAAMALTWTWITGAVIPVVRETVQGTVTNVWGRIRLAVLIQQF